MNYLLNRRKHFRTTSGDWTANNVEISAYNGYLKAYYKLEDISDSYGAHTLTNIGLVSFASAGKRGNCAALNGSSQYLSIADHVDFDFADNDFFMSMWVFADTINNNSAIFNQITTSGTDRSFVVYINGTTLQLYTSTNGSDWNQVSALDFGTISTGTWINFSFGRLGDDWRTYKNGANNASDTQSGTVYDSSSALVIGKNYVSGGAYWDGLIDELSIWNGMSFADSAAMDALASALYNGGTGAFLV